MNGKKQRGSTIVSVIAGFAVLMIACGMFYTAISMSWNMLNRAMDIRERVETAVENYYSEASRGGASSTEILNFGDFQIRGAAGRIFQDSEADLYIYYYAGS